MIRNYNSDERRFAKMKSDDRVLVLQVIPGQKAKTTGGMTDTRLFTGENKLHAKMDTNTCIWRMQYEVGGLPEPLKEQFTSFDRLLNHARKYYNTRGLDIVDIQYNHA